MPTLWDDPTATWDDAIALWGASTPTLLPAGVISGAVGIPVARGAVHAVGMPAGPGAGIGMIARLPEATLHPSGVASGVQIGTATVAWAGYSLHPSSVVSPGPGGPRVLGRLAAVGRATGLAWGVGRAVLGLHPGGVSRTAIGSSRVVIRATVAGVVGTQIGSPRIMARIAAVGRGSAVVVGLAAVRLVVHPMGLAATGYGIGRIQVTARPVGQANAQRFGVARFRVQLSLPSVVVAVAYGTPTGRGVVRPGGLSSHAAVGTPTLNRMHLTAVGVGSTVAVGIPVARVTARASGLATTTVGSARIFPRLRPLPWVPVTAIGGPQLRTTLHPTGLATGARGIPRITASAHATGRASSAVTGSPTALAQVFTHWLAQSSLPGLATVADPTALSPIHRGDRRARILPQVDAGRIRGRCTATIIPVERRARILLPELSHT